MNIGGARTYLLEVEYALPRGTSLLVGVYVVLHGEAVPTSSNDTARVPASFGQMDSCQRRCLHDIA